MTKEEKKVEYIKDDTIGELQVGDKVRIVKFGAKILCMYREHELPSMDDILEIVHTTIYPVAYDARLGNWRVQLGEITKPWQIQVEKVKENLTKEKPLIPKTAMQIYHKGQWVNCSIEGHNIHWEDI